MQLCASKIDMIGPIIQWFPDLSSCLWLFCSTSFLPVTYLGCDRDFKHVLCPILPNTRMGQFPQRSSRPLIQLIFCISVFTVLSWKYKTLESLVVLSDSLLPASSKLMPISRKIRWVYFLLYHLQLDKTTTVFAKITCFFSTAPLDAIACMKDSSSHSTVLYSSNHVIKFSLK